jgi:tetratricopeptide (TPR) repeat protein
VSRISTIVSEAERKEIHDKSSVQKFSLLLVVIAVLSVYIIIQGFSMVKEMPSYDNRYSSLETIERELNGNIVNLNVIEDDFSELSSIDLKGVSLFPSQRQSEFSSNQQIHIEAPVSKSAKRDKLKTTNKKIMITSQNGDSLSFIKKKFYATNNASFSIRLAKLFYNSKKYKKALKWSLITNEINSNSEESWLMFAKIKAKMGKKQDAINALNQYLKHSNSPKAVKLLKKIKKS